MKKLDESVAEYQRQREEMCVKADRELAERSCSQDLPPAVRAIFIENDVKRAAHFREWLRTL